MKLVPACTPFVVSCLVGCAAVDPPAPPTFDLAEVRFDPNVATMRGGGTLDEDGPHAARRSTPATRRVGANGAELSLECEAYLVLLDACIHTLPFESRGTFARETSRMRTAWAAIDDESDRESLRQMCIAGADTWSHEVLCR